MATSIVDLRSQPREDPQEDPAAPEDTQTAAPGESRLARGEILMSWEAPEYIAYKKTTAWYVVFGIVLALLLFSAFLLQSVLTGVVFLLSGILIFVYSERPPRRVPYEIRTSGVSINRRVYLYRDLSAFNVVERGDTVYMLLKSRRLIMPLIHVPLTGLDFQEVSEVMGAHLEEDDQLIEPFADVLSHWLGF